MTIKNKLEKLLEKFHTKKKLYESIKISRQSLYNFLNGVEPESHEVKLRIDFIYYKFFELDNPNDIEMKNQEHMLLESQYLINPSEEFVFKDFVKRFSFGSYEVESENTCSMEEFLSIADGGEIEKDISRKAFLEMNNLYSLSMRILKDAASSKKIVFTEELILQWHYSLMQGIRSDAGEYSTKIRIIENSDIIPVPAKEIRLYMEKWLKTSNEIKSIVDIAQSHAIFEKIHPFGDGNGRIGRLILAVQAIMSGLVPPLINGSNVAAYYAALESTQLGKKRNALASFLLKAMIETSKILPKLPKGLGDVPQKNGSSFPHYGYNNDFIENAFCTNLTILESFKEQTKKVLLIDVLNSIEAKNELTLEFSYGSSKIEGSTLSMLDTKRFLEKGYFPDYKYDDDDDEQKEIDKKMAVNNRDVMTFLLDEHPSVTIETVVKIHDMVVNDIYIQGQKGIATDIRTVLTSGGIYFPVVGVNKLVHALSHIVDRANDIIDPIDKSFFLHLNLAYLQPFEDGNKRTARAVANIPLVEAGITPFSYSSVVRDSYIKQIECFYEYGEFTEKFAGVILNSYEKSIEKLEELII